MSVWKRLQRVGKKAAKFQLTACYQSLTVECGRAYQPHRLIVVWTRRNRKYSTEPKVWTASLANPRQCCVTWELPENVEITSILYRDPKKTEYEDKDWTFVVEDQMASGRRKQIASRPVNLRNFCLHSGEAKQTPLTVKLKPVSKRVTSVILNLTLHSVLLDRERDAQDEDMVSIASLMSLNDGGGRRSGPGGAAASATASAHAVADLRDFDDEADDSSSSATTATAMDSSFSQLVEKLQRLDDDNDVVDEEEESATSKTPTNEALPPLPPQSLAPAAAEPESGSAASQDLLAWAQTVTADYKDRGVFVTNLTTSFRNGLAFCAVIHRHRPDLLEFSGLKAHDIRENNRRAFEAAHQLGVPRVLDPADMVMKTIPDQLLVMTFLHQLRAHFTKQEIRVARLGASESCYTLAVPEEEEVAVVAPPPPTEQPRPSEQQQQTLSKSKTDSSISAASAAVTVLAVPPVAAASADDPSSFRNLKGAQQANLARRAQDLRLLVRYNNDGTVREQVPAGPREGARQTAAKFQAKPVLTGPPAVPLPQQQQPSNHELKATEPEADDEADDEAQPQQQQVLSNFGRVLDTSAYVASERRALEIEQAEIDGQAVVLERRLRLVLCSAASGGCAADGGEGGDEQTLLTQWFQLVNKKNALIRRARQLDMLDQEQDLEKRYRMLELELRAAMSAEDWQKTEQERAREDLLLRDLMEVVRRRDQIVTEMDQHEREIVLELDMEQKAMDHIRRGGGGGGGRTCAIQ